MNYYFECRGGYGDSVEEGEDLLSAAPSSNPWQLGMLNPMMPAGHYAGNISNCNTVGLAESGAGQGPIIFQSFLGGQGFGGSWPPSSTGLHARWNINPTQLKEYQTSINLRDNHDQGKWANTDTAQIADDDLLQFSADQRPVQQNLQPKSGHCIIVYRECETNQALDGVIHCVNCCDEFLGRGRNRQEVSQFMACCCHGSYHRCLGVGDNGNELDNIDEPEGGASRISNDDLQLSLSKIETVALNLMEATGRALPLFAVDRSPPGVADIAEKELDTAMKISIENLDHISKVTLSTVECIGILHTAVTAQQSANSRNLLGVLDHGQVSSEVSPVRTTDNRRMSRFQKFNYNSQQADRNSASKAYAQKGLHPGRPKRKRTQFTDEQRRKMKAYAEHAGWTIVGQRKENITAACEDIGVTPTTLRYWIHNAKQNLRRLHEPSL